MPPKQSPAHLGGTIIAAADTVVIANLVNARRSVLAAAQFDDAEQPRPQHRPPGPPLR
jgi:hypothetical protein